MTNSYRQMRALGVIKRADGLSIRLDDIHEEPGFNPRIEGEDLEASIDALAQHIMAGGPIPELEVTPRAEGGVWVTDGHRRRRSLLKARAAGYPVEWIAIKASSGDRADRVARIVTSAEGRPLSALETAICYQRLHALDLSHAEIGRRVGRTKQHVEQLLILANASDDVKQLVIDGRVSATEAIKACREHGPAAGAWLQEQLGSAQASGKARVTQATLQGGLKLKPKQTRQLASAAAGFYRALFSTNDPAKINPRSALMKAMQGEDAEGNVTITMPASALSALTACVTALELDSYDNAETTQ